MGTLHKVTTYGRMNTAYVRTALRRALAVQDDIWETLEEVEAARRMAGLSDGDTPFLPDKREWFLTTAELTAIHRALEWSRSRRENGMADRRVHSSIITEWKRVEDEISRVFRGIHGAQ